MTNVPTPRWMVLFACCAGLVHLGIGGLVGAAPVELCTLHLSLDLVRALAQLAIICGGVGGLVLLGRKQHDGKTERLINVGIIVALIVVVAFIAGTTADQSAKNAQIETGKAQLAATQDRLDSYLELRGEYPPDGELPGPCDQEPATRWHVELVTFTPEDAPDDVARALELDLSVPAYYLSATRDLDGDTGTPPTTLVVGSTSDVILIRNRGQ